MNRTIRNNAAAAVAVLTVACNDIGGTAPTPATTQPPVVSNLPPLTGPFRTFAFGGELEHPVGNGTRFSKFFFYDNGAFNLSYDPQSPGYRGLYEEKPDGNVLFSWEGWSRAGPWGANATMKGDTLTIRYNDIMMMTGFEDALYIRQR